MTSSSEQPDDDLDPRAAEALRRMFAAAPPGQNEIVALLTAERSETARERQGSERTRRRWLVACLAAAAAVALVAWRASFVVAPGKSPHFETRPLAAIYRQAVENEFRPYYECHDPERFAATFAKRQDVPLKLLPMAPGCRMLGLSYLGGLSRDTTAMLCIVDEKPVAVFVDRASVDDPRAAADAGEGLRIFRRQDRGLVFYEVTPFEQSRVLDSLVADE